jgi:hypothetical protein
MWVKNKALFGTILAPIRHNHRGSQKQPQRAHMKNQVRLELSEDEAFALLHLAMTSEAALDQVSETAVRKLAEYCKDHQRNHSFRTEFNCELVGAG